MSRPKRVYVRLHHDLIDRYPDVWHDRDLRADFMALLVEADQAWPGSFLPSRLVADDSIATLAKLGVIEPRDHGRYVMVDHWQDRSERSEQAAANDSMRPDRHTPVGTPVGTDVHTPVHTDVGTPGGTERVHSKSQAKPSQAEQQLRAGAREAGPAATWRELYSTAASAGVLRWLDGLIEAHGSDEVVAAMRSVDTAGTDFLSRVQQFLEDGKAQAEQRRRDTAATAGLLMSRHNTGQHQDAPDPACRYCIPANGADGPPLPDFTPGLDDLADDEPVELLA